MKFTSRVYQGFLLVCALGVLLTVPALHAQQTLGSINGTITDSTGAAIPDANVVVTNNGTELTRSAKSRRNGFFQILNLPIGTYRVQVQHFGFQRSSFAAIRVQQGLATTIPVTLKVGSTATTVHVNANPMLNATDTTNGYTLDKAQIAATPLPTGSFTGLAVLAPGTSADLSGGTGTDQGLGNRNIMANGQRATDNSIRVNGVDVTNLFNGLSASDLGSQRYQFGIGEGNKVGGQSQDSNSIYGSAGNALASPPPDFINELQVNTSMYDASQGQTSGAHIDVSTGTGTNQLHGSLYGTYGSNSFDAVPYFYKQDIALGTLNSAYSDPALHKWIAGGTLGGPIMKNKLFFFIGYQHLYTSDQFGGVSQMQVPYGLTDDRSMAGIENALASFYQASNSKFRALKTAPNPTAVAILQAKLPDGQYLIPSVENPATALTNLENGNPDASLLGTSIFKGNQAVADLDYNVTATDHMSAKYYYQLTPSISPYGMSNVSGFPQYGDAGAQVFSLSNSTVLGSRVNWVQRIGFSRQKAFNDFHSALGASAIGMQLPGTDLFPGLTLKDFASKLSSASSLKVGPATPFFDAGFFENRVSPSSDAMFLLGNHTVSVGFNYSYNQLNIRNNEDGHTQLTTSNFPSFLEGNIHNGTILEGQTARHLRSNDVGAYVMDKWQVRNNVSITAGLRYDYNGPFHETKGLLFNFDPSLYSASDAAVTNSGFIVAGNNKQYGTPGVSDSTLKGRQWGVAPRVGIAWSPKEFNNRVVWRAGAGIYYDRGEYFQYLSPPAGQGISGPFGMTEEAPFAAYTNANGNLSSPFSGGLTAPTTPAELAATLPSIDKIEQDCTGANIYNGTTLSGYNCRQIPAIIGNYNIHNVLPYTENWTLDFEWQPANNLSIDIGYVGNRGKHSILPLPFNEPRIATPGNPINGQQYSYGVQTLSTQYDATGTPYINKYEPYDSFSGGNVDLRVPYVGYDPNSTSFTSAGISSYDALQAHVEKRMSNNFQFGASYTYSHTLDEQSDLGLFFTGDNPENLRSSYADSDFDRTNVITFNYLVHLPNLVKNQGNWLGYLTNHWSLMGLTVLESGEPYSVYDYSGSVGNQYFGSNISLLNPVLPLKPGIQPKQALTGHSGAMGQADPQLSALKAADFEVPLVNPGENGAPPCDTTTAGGNAGPGGGPLCDVFETKFIPGQRNIFRQSFQKRADITLEKDLKIRDRYNLTYQFEVFNLTNTPSFDVPNNDIVLSPSYLEMLSPNDPNYPYANGTQVQPYANGNVTTPSGTGSCQGSSQACAYELYSVPGARSNKLGVVQNTEGSARIIEMQMHLTF